MRCARCAFGATNCVVRDNPTVTELIDYDEFCGTAPVGLIEEGAHA
jgi:hypothetical protein